MRLLLADSTVTEALGAALGRNCPWNSSLPRAIYLKGELGAGKTTLVRGLLRALGVAGTVRSPSYALLEPYSVAAGTVVHADLYRVRDAREAESLGLRDEFRGSTLVLIEWPEHAGAAVPAPDVELTLWIEGDHRLAELAARSIEGQAWLAAAGAGFQIQNSSEVISSIN